MQTQTQTELPNMLSQDLASLIDRITEHDVPKGYEWPKILNDFIAVIQCELARRHVAAPEKLGVGLVLAIAEYIGGRELYIPSGDTLKTAINNLEIYREWMKSGEVLRLSQAHDLTERRVYQIIAEQRALHKSTQARLFAA